MRRGMCLAVLGIPLISLAPRVVAAQSDTASAQRCLAELPASVFTRVPVYLQADALDSTVRHVLPIVDLLTESVAARARALLGAEPHQLPRGDSTLSWRHLGPTFVVAVYPDARFSWRASDTSKSAGSARQPGAELLERALVATSDAGERIFFPEGVVRDSLLFMFSYRWPNVTPLGQIEPLETRFAIPVFTLPIPWEKPATTRRPPRVLYPEGSITDRAEGGVLLQFVVDTTGRVDLRTVRDLWPPDRPRLTGALGDHYNAFLAAARRALDAARYEPAQIGGCRVRQLVQQPFDFRLRH